MLFDSGRGSDIDREGRHTGRGWQFHRQRGGGGCRRHSSPRGQGSWGQGGEGEAREEVRQEVWRTTRRDNLRGVIVSRSFSLACSVLDSRYATGLIGTKHYCGFDSEACLGSPHSELVCVVCTR